MIKSVQAQIDELKKLYKNCLCNCFKGTIHIVSEEEFDEESPLEGWEPPENPQEGVTVIVEFTDGTVAYYTYDGTDWVYDFSLSAGGETPEAPYKVYTALLSQSGTDAPTAIVLENTIGEITWSYDDVGSYVGTCEGCFPENKTYSIIFPEINMGSDAVFYLHPPSYSAISISSYYNGWDGVPSPSNSLIDGVRLEIRVYP